VVELCLSLLQATSRQVTWQWSNQYYYANNDQSLRQKAIWALGISGNQRAVPALINALESGTLNERKEAAIALGNLKNRTAVVPLIAALRHFGADARPAVVKALTKITGKDFGLNADRWQAWKATGK
jgi:HEAT repeat protein